MIRFIRRSLLAQLLGMYLGFVVALLGTGLMLRELVLRQLIADAEANNLALARSVAHEIGGRLLADRATMLRLMSADNPSPAELAKQAKTSPEAITQLKTVLRDYLTASRNANGQFEEMICMNIPRQSLSAPIEAIRDEHAQRGESVSLQILNENDQLIASSIPGEISLERYPGAVSIQIPSDLPRVCAGARRRDRHL